MKTARERLIDSASTLFAERGFHGVSTREISAHAKANISLLSFYFGSKNGLLKTILESLAESGMSEIDKILTAPASSEDFQQRLQLFLETLSTFYIRHSAILRIYMHELENGNVDAIKCNGETFGGMWERLVSFLETAKQKQIIHHQEVRVLALSILSPFTSLMQNKNCMSHLVSISLENEKFRKEMIQQIVHNTAS